MYDVAIIGGGPGGSNTAALLKKYRPGLSILILEKEVFPREHVGESQLPPISAVLHEMGCWEKVEAAGFPVKIGATYTWGRTTDPWVFGFLPDEDVPADPKRPGVYENWRVQTAFQVDRAIYDKIMLDHARSMGVEVREGTRVAEILRTGDRVDGLKLESGEVVTARYYVDSSGAAAILRRAMGVAVDAPTLLRNVAFWDYWTDENWAKEPDTSVTRVHIRSLPYGWIWFIRLSPTRTSIGLVCPAEYYRSCGKSYTELYHEALRTEKEIARRTRTATSRNKVEATTDWSFVVDRLFGENWFLVGECSGFADPILAAGLTLTQTGARELAYTILELERGELDRSWLLAHYDEVQKRRVVQHMRFAEYWYSANGIFEDIRENCTRIAADAGLRLNPADAFRWLSQGGLADDIPGQVGIGGLDVAGVKQVMNRFTGGKASWTINGMNVFKLNLNGAKEGWSAKLDAGRITRIRSYERGPYRLYHAGLHGLLIDILGQTSDLQEIMASLRRGLARTHEPAHVPLAVNQAMQVLEVMANDYWVTCSVKKGKPTLDISTPVEGALIHTMETEATGAG